MPQQYWRFSGIEDLLGVVGSSVASAVLFALLLVVSGFPIPTKTFPVIHAITLMIALGTPRVVYRLRRGRARAPGREAQSVLLAGAGENADLFLRALDTREGRAAFRVAGLLSLGPGSVGRRMHGRPIFGALDQTAAVLARLRQDGRPVSAVVVTEPGLQGDRLADLLAQAEAEGVPVRQMPPPTRLLASPEGEAVPLAPVAIEDLLNRPQVPLDREGMARLVRGRRVLVTGAGGTIGSELARQVASLAPSLLVLLDNGEYALWQIDTELAETQPGVARQICLADIRDEGRMRAVCDAVRPELVFHAAALKHVPMVEANPLEGLMTNAVGTRIVADAARASGAAQMVFISTDKAVNPSSVMGASKRLAEMYVQALDVAARRLGGMRCVTVRFGNVLGSTGSVVPLFRHQLERGGPLTVTHPDMQRYFMTVREAVGLVLQASVVGNETDLGEGGIFVLDMGKPVRIVDLARQMIRLAGLKVAESEAPVPGAIEIVFTGLRPGEKLFEELFHGREPPVPTGYAGLLMATPRTADPAIVGRAIDEIAAFCRSGQPATALGVLAHMVPEFEPDQAAAPAAVPGG
jgi:O-antigen biosynthesis protein WbqV